MFKYSVIGISVCLLAAAAPTPAPGGEVLVPDDKGQCVKKLVQWCSGMKYPQEGAGMSMVSITYTEPSGYYRVFCVSDSDGTNCTRNGSPWFNCSPDNKYFYKGNLLTAGSTTGADDEICKTADKAFNELFVQNLSYDNTTLKSELQKGLEGFFDQMAFMEAQIEALHERMSRFPLFGSDFDNFYGDGFLFGSSNSTTVTPGTLAQDNSEKTNQVEKE